MADESWVDRITAGDEEPPEEILAQTPKGAMALAGVTVGLLIVCWLAVYLFVFLPRGPVS